jgi:hypothetical protein
METLKFNGHTYILDKVVAKANSGPSVTVDIGKINSPGDPKAKVVTSAFLPEFDNKMLILVEQLGQYTVLGGKEIFKKAVKFGNPTVSGKLISKVALKKALVE